MPELTDPKPKVFVFPSLEDQADEISRVKEQFGIERDDFVDAFSERVRTTALTELTEDVWQRLENPDSFSVQKGAWDDVKRISEEYERDWESLKQKIDTGVGLDAPIIVKVDDTYHLLCGNTRLMVARGHGLASQVLIVDIGDLR